MPLPEGLEKDAEASVSWKRGAKKTVVTVELDGVEIRVKVPHDKADLAPWLVAALPNALAAAWDQIEAQEASE